MGKTNEAIFMKGTRGFFKRSVIVEEIKKDNEEILTVVPHGSKATILSIIPLKLEVLILGQEESSLVRMHEPRRLGEVFEVTYNPGIGKIL